MRFMAAAECREWARGLDIALDDGGKPVRVLPGWHLVKRDTPQAHMQLTWFCRHVERSLQPRTACLLWVTDWGIWEENLHLYYRLRQSYGDQRLLHEAPGHYCLDFEGADLITFLEVAVLCGWDAHLLPVTGYARAFVSHDEYIEFAANPSNLAIAEEFARDLSLAGKSGERPGTSRSMTVRKRSWCRLVVEGRWSFEMIAMYLANSEQAIGRDN